MGNGLEADPEVLLSTADAISAYCSYQKKVLEEYWEAACQLHEDWNDEKTYGRLIEEIKRLKNQVYQMMEEAERTYPHYFKEKAEMILSRASLRIGDSSTRSFSGSIGTSGLGESVIKKTAHNKRDQNVITTKEYITKTFAIPGINGGLKSTLENCFARAPQAIMVRINEWTDRLKFADSQNGCYYDPIGKGGKSIIGVDTSEKDISDHLVSCVALHVFYFLDPAEREDMRAALKKDGKSLSEEEKKNAAGYLDDLRKGADFGNHSEDASEDILLSKKSYRQMAKFFAECFKEQVFQTDSGNSTLKKYFPNAYQVAEEIMKRPPDTLVLVKTL